MTDKTMTTYSGTHSHAVASKAVSKAFRLGIPFFACRYPGKKEIIFGACDTPEKGGLLPGFTIAPFANEPDKILTITPRYSAEEILSGEAVSISAYAAPFHAMPEVSTPREAHAAEIVSAQKELSVHGGGKIVVAKVTVEDNRGAFSCGDTLGETFLRMASDNPEAMVFVFHTPQSGTYMGISPELLMKAENGRLTTMALAGTRRRGSEDQEWDTKNIEEQRMVADYITYTFLSHGFKTENAPSITLASGKVEHICTPISATPDRPEAVGDVRERLSRFLLDFSPTPAFCGLPKEKSLRFLLRNETFDRGYYGGYCGLYASAEDFAYYVNMRSVRISGDLTAYFAGGGITLKSDPDSEWTETEMKISTIRAYMHRGPERDTDEAGSGRLYGAEYGGNGV